ncbi:hypothetical protein DRO66_02450 [Candidatus Bathyarchaeota archaeon]|nr:MAG: hypothetical protein DRO66_02450 [Candidatus Bathyarchaeota archaeon]
MRRKKNRHSVRLERIKSECARRFTDVLLRKVSEKNALRIIEIAFEEILVETARVEDSKHGFRFVLRDLGIFSIKKHKLRGYSTDKSRLQGIIPYKPIFKFMASKKLTKALMHQLHGFVQEER